MSRTTTRDKIEQGVYTVLDRQPLIRIADSKQIAQELSSRKLPVTDRQVSQYIKVHGGFVRVGPGKYERREA